MAATTPGQRCAQIVRAFLRRPGVTQQGRGFGCTAFKVRGKMFATLSQPVHWSSSSPAGGSPRLPKPGGARHLNPAPAR